MKQIQLPNSTTRTSQLGFGCSSLMGAIGRRESLALLEHAFDAGIRHFDVAPMYGYGAAEGCLGEFASRHFGKLTLTTKYGIPPPANPGLVHLARRAVTPLLKMVPSIKKRLQAAASVVTPSAPMGNFTPSAARASLEHSLAELRVERVDLWLLHEAEVEHLEDDALLRVLEDSVRSGKVGAFGVGSSADRIPALLAHRPAYCPVLQFEWSVLDRPFEPVRAFTIHHRSLTANFAALHSALQKNAPVRERWSAEIGMDLKQPGALAGLMLKAALVFNPESVVLVSSRNPAHILENVRVAEDDRYVAPARTLFALTQREGATVSAGS